MTIKQVSLLVAAGLSVVLLLPLPAGRVAWGVEAAVRAVGKAGSVQAPGQEEMFTMPAEFEEIDSVWMAWPVYENIHGRPSQSVLEEMIRALEPHVAIDLMVQDESEAREVSRWLKETHLPAARIRLHVIPHTDIWVRDMGPIFLKNGKGRLKIADFGFNGWSYDEQTSASSMTDESVDRLVARGMKLPVVRSSLVSEGGDREFNGKGTMMVTEAVELNRNPGMSKQQIEDEFKRVFNVKKVIWLKEGVTDDDFSYKGKLPGNLFTLFTTGGHIDEYARFVTPDTILLAEVTEEEANESRIARETRRRMEVNFEILKNATDQDGRHFTIIRVPVPVEIEVQMDGRDEIFRRLRLLRFEDGTVIGLDDRIGTVLATSYLNFVIANKVVLVPAYWKQGRPDVIRNKDEAFRRIMSRVFPGRKIVQINPESVNAGGGGMHCITQQMPKGAPGAVPSLLSEWVVEP